MFQTVSQNSQERFCVTLFYPKSRLCRLRHTCFHVDFAKFLRRPILKNLNQIAVNIRLKQYNNNVFRESKPPAPTRIGKQQLENLSAFLLPLTEQIWFTNCPSFLRDLYLPIKCQILLDQTTNSPCICAPKHRTKNNLHSHRDRSVKWRCCDIKFVNRRRKYCEREIYLFWLS